MADIDELERQVQELRDREEIRELKARLMRAADAQDWDTYRSLITDDYHFTSDGGVQDGADLVVATVSKALDGASTVHQIYAPLVTITGPDTASASWRMADWVRMVHDGRPMAFHGHGSYHEEYVRTADGWRVAKTVMERIRVDPIDDASAKPGG